ncbi:hypothetical protein GCM10022225_57270 [Plantactinospora mayteni]|uniref:Ceramidase n=1 Tax=Plantactinospora mayteni TaxID=566021 RepID=A0ABQ4F1S5_9ACTN|nr:hypothetical protein [Plantactinospora mayteni]GIH00869.1 hypothetical protein Pma05_74410 [Plantactinospora mayteni]
MYVDSYCERTAPGLWNEPANAVSNLAFLAASALLLWLLAGQRHRVPVSVWLLPVLLGIVGLASLAFHTVATRLTSALDSLAILLFVLVGVAVVLHWMWRVRWRWAWLAAPAFLGFAVGLNLLLYAAGGERATVGGYAPALAGLAALGLAVRFTAPPDAARFGGWLLGAAALFTASLTLRTLDGPLCADLPVGTHFLWHCLNATVLFLVSYAVLRRWQQTVAPR